MLKLPQFRQKVLDISQAERNAPVAKMTCELTDGVTPGHEKQNKFPSFPKEPIIIATATESQEHAKEEEACITPRRPLVRGMNVSGLARTSREPKSIEETLVRESSQTKSATKPATRELHRTNLMDGDHDGKLISSKATIVNADTDHQELGPTPSRTSSRKRAASPASNVSNENAKPAKQQQRGGSGQECIGGLSKASAISSADVCWQNYEISSSLGDKFGRPIPHEAPSAKENAHGQSDQLYQSPPNVQTEDSEQGIRNMSGPGHHSQTAAKEFSMQNHEGRSKVCDSCSGSKISCDGNWPCQSCKILNHG